MEIYCKYCKESIEDKGYKADGHRYHLKCLRKFRKEINHQKMKGKVKPGKENDIQVSNKYINQDILSK